MTRMWKSVLFIIILGSSGVLLHLLGQPKESFALDGQSSDQGTVQQPMPEEEVDLDALHARNIASLHSLYHQMKGAVKKKDAAQIIEQLHALQQTLGIVESTERNHPQWPLSWGQRHAKLLSLSKEMEILAHNLTNIRHDGKTFAHMGRQLREMKMILDLW